MTVWCVFVQAENLVAGSAHPRLVHLSFLGTLKGEKKILKVNVFPQFPSTYVFSLRTMVLSFKVEISFIGRFIPKINKTQLPGHPSITLFSCYYVHLVLYNSI